MSKQKQNRKNYDQVKEERFQNNGQNIVLAKGQPGQVRGYIRNRIRDKTQIITLAIHMFDPSLAAVAFVTDGIWDRNEHQLEADFVDWLISEKLGSSYNRAIMLSGLDENIYVLNTTHSVESANPYVQRFFRLARKAIFDGTFVSGTDEQTNTLLFAPHTNQPRYSSVLYEDQLKPLPTPFMGQPTRDSIIGRKGLLQVPVEGQEIQAITAYELFQYAIGRSSQEKVQGAWKQFIEIDDSIIEMAVTDDDSYVILTTEGDKRLRAVLVSWKENGFNAVLSDELSIKSNEQLEKQGGLSRASRGNLLFVDADNGVTTMPRNFMRDVDSMLTNVSEQARQQTPAAAE